MSYISITSRSVLPSCYSFYIRYATKNGTFNLGNRLSIFLRALFVNLNV